MSIENLIFNYISKNYSVNNTEFLLYKSGNKILKKNIIKLVCEDCCDVFGIANTPALNKNIILITKNTFNPNNI